MTIDALDHMLNLLESHFLEPEAFKFEYLGHKFEVRANYKSGLFDINCVCASGEVNLYASRLNEMSFVKELIRIVVRREQEKDEEKNQGSKNDKKKKG